MKKCRGREWTERLPIRFGIEPVAVSMVPGARIELATPAFSGRRSTNELPRHWCLEIVGVMHSCVNSAKKHEVTA
jgi:hypothetical protein